MGAEPRSHYILLPPQGEPEHLQHQARWHGRKQITPDGFDEDWHAWSPDGKLLVYSGTPVITGEERPRYDIFLMDMVSGKVTALAADTLSEQAPVFVRMDRRGA
ncbi:MAG: PD40 domain-containing protein [Flavobacteriales bacterium]|nr:PD40 domain-containing protein [Flavobacteriales bacterium]